MTEITLLVNILVSDPMEVLPLGSWILLMYCCVVPVVLLVINSDTVLDLFQLNLDYQIVNLFHDDDMIYLGTLILRKFVCGFVGSRFK